MSTVKNETPSIEELTTDTGGEPVPGHDEWFREKVQASLDEKAQGDAKYVSLDEVAKKFGYHAR